MSSFYKTRNSKCPPYYVCAIRGILGHLELKSGTPLLLPRGTLTSVYIFLRFLRVIDVHAGQTDGLTTCIMCPILHITIPKMHHNKESSGSGSCYMNTSIYSMPHEWIFKSVQHLRNKKAQLTQMERATAVHV